MKLKIFKLIWFKPTLRITYKIDLLTSSQRSDQRIPFSWICLPSKILALESNQNFPKCIGMVFHPWEKHCSSCLLWKNGTKRSEWSTKRGKLRATTLHATSEPCFRQQNEELKEGSAVKYWVSVWSRNEHATTSQRLVSVSSSAESVKLGVTMWKGERMTRKRLGIGKNLLNLGSYWLDYVERRLPSHTVV